MLAGCQSSVSVSRVTISANFLPDWISLKFIQWPSFPSKIDTLSLSENCKKRLFLKILNQIIFRDVKQGTQRGSPGFSQFVLSSQMQIGENPPQLNG